jgi:hypothetical protein
MKKEARRKKRTRKVERGTLVTAREPVAPGQLGLEGVAGGQRGPNLRPFFGYYGGKWRDALKHYPPPEYGLIVEPFAGSAGYALRYSDRDVVLCDKDPVIAGVWKFLVKASRKEIENIPFLGPDESVDDLKIPEEARWLVGFWLNRATSRPRKSPSRWMRDRIRPGSFWGERVRRTIAEQVDAIKHWKVYECGYEECPVVGPATWFIDPPYQAAGKHYRHGSEELEFDKLAQWCLGREGQVIVCENAGATWLEFEELADVKTTRAKRRSKEVVWIRNPAGAPAPGKPRRRRSA